jgi:hypothetical protein
MNPRPSKKREGGRSTGKLPADGSLIAMYRGPSISFDLRVNHPDSRFAEIIAMIKSAFPGLKVGEGLAARTYRDHAQAQSQGQDMSSSGFADFVIEEMGKLFASEEDLERMKAAIQKELSRRETTS